MNELDYNFKLRSGKYKGRTLRWLLTNDVDYLVWITENQPTMLRPLQRSKSHSANKQKLKPYPKVNEEALKEYLWQRSLLRMCNYNFDQQQIPFPNIKEGDLVKLCNLKANNAVLNGLIFPVVLIWENIPKEEFRIRVQDISRKHIKYAKGLLDVKSNQIIKTK